MGYDLHITRRQDWSGAGDDIAKEEFVARVRADPEFTYPGENGGDYADWRSPRSGSESWLCWDQGRISSKNPNAEFIDKMVSVADSLGAKVQGDDGEVYRSAADMGGAARPAAAPPAASFWETLVGAWRRLQGKPAASAVRLPFRVGDKVYDTWDDQHTVIAIDPQAEHGIGIIRTRRDRDGVELGQARIAHDLTLTRKQRVNPEPESGGSPPGPS